jgi:hypothetical protein
MVAMLRTDTPDQQSDDRNGDQRHQNDVEYEHFRPPVPGQPRLGSRLLLLVPTDGGPVVRHDPSYRHLKTLSYKSLWGYLRSRDVM